MTSLEQKMRDKPFISDKQEEINKALHEIMGNSMLGESINKSAEGLLDSLNE